MKRRVLLAAGLALPRLAAAQSPPAIACVERPGDIVRLMLEGFGTPAGRIAVFGQAFRPGALPSGRGLAARIDGGAALPVQVDINSRHPDGSARLAVIALSCPALPARATATVVLAAAAQADAPVLDVAAALAAHRAEIQVGNWRMDLLAQFQAALAARPWQRGPLAVQARIATALPPAAVGGVASVRLVADVSLRADGSLWVDAWLRNDVAMQPNGGAAAYPLHLVLDGGDALRAEIGRQHQYTAWGRLRGTAPAPPRIRHDATYLADTGAVARYDLSAGVDEAILRRLGDTVLAPGWATPLGPRDITQNMYQAGGRSDIGPATLAQAVWLMTGDARAAAYAEGQAEAAGSIPWHFWDGARGGWMDPTRFRALWTDGRGGRPPGGLAQPIAGDTGWEPDCAHQPDLCFVPFLLTGRRALLDNLQAQASWCVLSQWPAPTARGAAGATGVGEGVNVVRGNQVRGSAWSLRQLDNAGWASPDNDPALPWLRAASAGNWGWLRANLAGWSSQQGEAQGWIPGEYGTAGVLVPWQQDYFASTAANAARRGDADARAVLEWMSGFLVGRFKAGPRGFSPNDGVAYQIAIIGDGGRVLRQWAEIGAATRARGLSNETGWSKAQGNFAQLAIQSLAALSDVLDTQDAASAYAWLAASGAPFIGARDFARDPLLNIVPRGRPRTGSAARCRA
ncbi:hypothetical protein ACQW02_25990 [Humitalea sp. 24SJ18S-53]|uniref:hypothetical protein n=1 Tax=Humitalea sp. 24SJ18S-53 TaxID=3422307 RepID=UPI003D67E7ED